MVYKFFFCFIFETCLNKLLDKVLVAETLIGDNAGKVYGCLCNLDFDF